MSSFLGVGRHVTAGGGEEPTTPNSTSPGSSRRKSIIGLSMTLPLSHARQMRASSSSSNANASGTLGWNDTNMESSFLYNSNEFAVPSMSPVISPAGYSPPTTMGLNNLATLSSSLEETDKPTLIVVDTDTMVTSASQTDVNNNPPPTPNGSMVTTAIGRTSIPPLVAVSLEEACNRGDFESILRLLERETDPIYRQLWKTSSFTNVLQQAALNSSTGSTSSASATFSSLSSASVSVSSASVSSSSSSTNVPKTPVTTPRMDRVPSVLSSIALIRKSTSMLGMLSAANGTQKPTESDEEDLKWMKRRRRCMTPCGPDSDLPFFLLVRQHRLPVIATFLAALDSSIQREVLIWRNKKKRNILHEAALRSELNTLAFLVSVMNELELRLPIDEEDSEGHTPIELTNDVHCLALLLHAGASPRIGEKFHGDHRGLTVLLRHGTSASLVRGASRDEALKNRGFQEVLEVAEKAAEDEKAKMNMETLKTLQHWSKSGSVVERRMAARCLRCMKQTDFGLSSTSKKGETSKTAAILGQIILQLLCTPPKEISSLIDIYTFLGQLNSWDGIPINEILKWTKPAVSNIVDQQLHLVVARFLARATEIRPLPDFPLVLITALNNLINGKTVADATKFAYLPPMEVLTRDKDTAAKFSYVGCVEVMVRLTQRYLSEPMGKTSAKVLANLIAEETGATVLARNRNRLLERVIELCDIRFQLWPLCEAFVGFITLLTSQELHLSDINSEVVKASALSAGALRVFQDLAMREWPEGEKESWKYVVRKAIDASQVVVNWPSNDGNVKLLGQGGSGAVYSGKWKELQIAVKEILQSRDFSPMLLRREIVMLSMFSHPNIVKFYGAFIQNGKYYLVTELATLGSLREVLERHTLTNLQKLNLALGIARGLKYLHSLGVCHRDLKGSNILVFENFIPKLTDFGITRLANPTEFTSLGGTFHYMPPEIFKLTMELRSSVSGITTQVLPASDTYSFGYLLWELEHNREAYPGCNVAQVVKAKTRDLKTKSMPLPLPEGPSLWPGLLERCWCFEVEQRPTMDEIVTSLETVHRLETVANIIGSREVEETTPTPKSSTRGSTVGMGSGSGFWVSTAPNASGHITNSLLAVPGRLKAEAVNIASMAISPISDSWLRGTKEGSSILPTPQ